MAMIVIIIVPLVLLMLGAVFLVVAQVSGFVQYGLFTQREHFSKMVIQQYMERIALAQSQIYQRSRQLEVLSSKLALSNQELGRLNDMKSKFLSMVVHDVRNPLASIRGFGELLAKNVKEEKQATYLKYIVQATDQLGRLISDLTDLAMIEAGKLKMEKKNFAFYEIAADILPGMLIRTQQKNIELIFLDLPHEIIGNGAKFRLSQVLMNLLGNAIKFTPSGGKIELRMRLEGRKVGIYVKDSGIGLHLSDARKVFEKFYQAKYQKDKDLRKQGWGLGLAISQEIVKSHNGDIGVTSPGLGKGSTFWFKTPL